MNPLTRAVRQQCKLRAPQRRSLTVAALYPVNRAATVRERVLHLEASRLALPRFCKSVTIARGGTAMVSPDGEGTKVLLARRNDRNAGAGADRARLLLAETGPVAR